MPKRLYLRTGRVVLRNLCCERHKYKTQQVCYSMLYFAFAFVRFRVRGSALHDDDDERRVTLVFHINNIHGWLGAHTDG